MPAMTKRERGVAAPHPQKTMARDEQTNASSKRTVRSAAPRSEKVSPAGSGLTTTTEAAANTQKGNRGDEHPTYKERGSVGPHAETDSELVFVFALSRRAPGSRGHGYALILVALAVAGLWAAALLVVVGVSPTVLTEWLKTVASLMPR